MGLTCQCHSSSILIAHTTGVTIYQVRAFKAIWNSSFFLRVCMLVPCMYTMLWHHGWKQQYDNCWKFQAAMRSLFRQEDMVSGLWGSCHEICWQLSLKIFSRSFIIIGLKRHFKTRYWQPYALMNLLSDETEEEFSTRLAENLEKLILKEGPETVSSIHTL